MHVRVHNSMRLGPVSNFVEISAAVCNISVELHSTPFFVPLINKRANISMAHKRLPYRIDTMLDMLQLQVSQHFLAL